MSEMNDTSVPETNRPDGSNNLEQGAECSKTDTTNTSSIRHFKKALIYQAKSDCETVMPGSPVASVSGSGPINLSVVAKSDDSETDLPLNLQTELSKGDYSSEDCSKYSDVDNRSESMVVDDSGAGRDEADSDGDRKSSSSSILMPSPSITPIPQMVTHVGRKPLNGPPCSLKTLVDDNILDPLDGSLTYEIMGSKFFGDLLPNGFIRLSGTTQLFANPSSWANYCRSTIPSCSKDFKNYGSAWSIIRYLGKRLDSYKLRWYRKQKKQYMGSNGSQSPSSTTTPTVSASPANGTAKGKSSLDTLMANYTAVAQAAAAAFPLNTNYSSLRGLNYFQSHSSQSSRNSDYKGFVNLMNRERLYKLDKLSVGDPEVNAEKANEENVFEFNSIDLNQLLDRRSRIACVPFNTTYCMQPFQVTVSTNVLLLVDFHSHLISAEVCGYLAGSWDPRLQHLSITQAYPLRERSIVAQKAHVCRIQQSVLEKGLVVVGWYHSHPNTFPHPSVADIRKQLQYQKQFLTNRRGQGEYSPCVGLIISPFYQRVSQKPTSLFQLFWVMPVFTSHNQDIGRPMQLSYSLSRDAFLTQDLLVEMRMLATHFSTHSKFVKFTQPFEADQSSTYWDKLQESLKIKLPRDLVEAQPQTVQNDIQQQALVHFWSFLKNLLFIT